MKLIKFKSKNDDNNNHLKIINRQNCFGLIWDKKLSSLILIAYTEMYKNKQYKKKQELLFTSSNNFKLLVQLAQ